MELVRKKASIIFYILDESSEYAITTAIVSEEQHCFPVPINKKDGYYVFINLKEGKYKFFIEAANYTPVYKEVNFEHAKEPLFIETRLKRA